MSKEEELTPAQQYRLAIAQMSKEEVALLRLEGRWARNLPKWTVSAGFQGVSTQLFKQTPAY